nr:FMN-binding protein [Enterococcus sp.]
MKTRKFMVGMTVFAFSALVLGACSPDNNEESGASSSAASSEVVESTTTSSTATESSAAAPGVVLQDGTYNLEEKNYNNGYRVVFSMEVKDGKIVASNYDNVNEEGKSKVEDADYNKNMQDKAGMSPEEY